MEADDDVLLLPLMSFTATVVPTGRNLILEDEDEKELLSIF